MKEKIYEIEIWIDLLLFTNSFPSLRFSIFCHEIEYGRPLVIPNALIRTTSFVQSFLFRFFFFFFLNTIYTTFCGLNWRRRQANAQWNSYLKWANKISNFIILFFKQLKWKRIEQFFVIACHNFVVFFFFQFSIYLTVAWENMK